MRNYEITFIVDPVLSGDEIDATAKLYADYLKEEECNIVHFGEMGLRQLAYPIKKRHSGVYFCIEFSSETGKMIPKMELAMRRDGRIMRFLTVALDKFGVKYNADKRAGKIGSSKKKKKSEDDKKKDSPAKNVKEVAPKKSEKVEKAVAVAEEE